MTALAQEVIKTFDNLPDSDKLEVALKIFQRVVNFDFPPLTDEDLILNAEELFLALDGQEVEDYE